MADKPIDTMPEKGRIILQKMRDSGRFDNTYLVNQVVKAGGVNAGFVESQRAKGRSDDEIAHFIFTGKSHMRPTVPQTARLATNVSAANLAGSPTDVPVFMGNLAIAGAEKSFPSLGELPRIPESPIGSRAIRQAMQERAPGSVYETIEDLAPGERPLARLLETTISTGGLGLGVVGVAKGLRGFKLTRPGSFLDDIGRYSKRFLSEEMSFALGGGSAAALAELSGASPGWVTAWEMTGSVVTPYAALSLVARKTAQNANDVIATYTGKAGVEGLVARRIQKVLREHGHDPAKLAEELRKVRVVGKDGQNLYMVRDKDGKLVSTLTPAQLTGNDILWGYEDELARLSPKYGDDRIRKAKDSMAALRELANTLHGTGIPELVIEAGRVRMAAYEKMFEIKFADTQQEIANIMAEFGSKGDTLTASKKVGKTLEAALEWGNKKEKRVWSKVSYKDYVDGESTAAGIRKYDEATADLAISIPDVEKFRILHKDGFLTGQVPSRRLQALRSRLLERTRDKSLTPTEKKLHFELAESIWKDLEKVESPEGIAARDFTKALNETFGETFAGEATETIRGLPGIAPERLLDEMFRSKDARSIPRMEQLRNAAAFGKFNVDGQIESYLGDRLRRDVFDSNTGTISSAKLKSWLDDPVNQEVFSSFPGLKYALRDVDSANQHMQALEKIKRASDQQIKKATFAKAAGATDTTKLVEKSLLPAPEHGMRAVGLAPTLPYERLVRLAKNQSDATVDGLKYATLDVAFRKATSTSGDMSWKRLNHELTKPIPESKTGLLSLMVRHNVMSGAEAKRWRTILEEATRLEKQLTEKAPRLTDEPTLTKIEPSLSADFFVRAGGANLATNLPIASSLGGSLIVAQEGSKVAQELFKNMPGTRIKEIAIKAGEDPEFLAMLLEKGSTSKKYTETVRRAYLSLIQAGITAPGELGTQPALPEPPKGDVSALRFGFP